MSSPEALPETPVATPQQGLVIDPAKWEAFQQRLQAEQSPVMAVVAGAVAAVVGAAIWAVVTVATMYQIGFMAMGVGFLVGVAVRAAGKGTTPTFGIIGAALSLIGCLLGNLLSACGIVANFGGVSFWTELSTLNVDRAIGLMQFTFSPMDVLFYAIAVYEGYRFSFRQITEEELRSLMKAQA